MFSLQPAANRAVSGTGQWPHDWANLMLCAVTPLQQLKAGLTHLQSCAGWWMVMKSIP